jgi:cholesterol transport system auxiliary component
MKQLIIGLIILLSSACSVINKQPAQHDFGLYALPTSKQSLAKSEITVESPAWLANECIQFRLLYSEPTRLRCYSLDQWIAPPSELFKQQLQTSAIATKQRLQIQLLNFEQQFDSPKQARVVLTIVVNAYQPQSDRLIATQIFKLEQATASPDAAGAVLGFAQLTRLATDKIQHWLINLAN